MIALADGATFAFEKSPDQAKSAVNQISATGSEAVAEMRRLLGVLRNDDGMAMKPQPGIAQLDDLVEQVRAAGLAVRLVSSGKSIALTAGAAWWCIASLKRRSPTHSSTRLRRLKPPLV